MNSHDYEPTESEPTATMITNPYEDSPGALGFVIVKQEEGGREFLRYDVFVAALFKQMAAPMMKLHAAIGVAGEAGELCDAIKRETIYGKLIDRKNLVEELGDLRFYIQAAMNIYGVSEQEVLQENFNKLIDRYKGLEYSDAAAVERADKIGE